MRRSCFPLLFFAAAISWLSACKKNTNDNNQNPNNLSTSHLRLIHAEAVPDPASMNLIEARTFSITPDGNIHALYIAGSVTGMSSYYRRTFNSNGDSIGTPAISGKVMDIVRNNDVYDTWHFAPYTDKLALSYHPAGSYRYELYLAEGVAPLYTHQDPSFGGLPRLLSNGGALVDEGYQQYFSNPPVLNAQAYCYYYPATGPVQSYLNLHVYDGTIIYPATVPLAEDEQRRDFWAAPLPDGTLALAYANGHHFYVERYNAIAGSMNRVDSIATSMLQPLDRVCCADTWLEATTSPDESRIIYFFRYLSGAHPSDNTYHYSTFSYNTANGQITPLIQDVVLPIDIIVNYDGEGNLIYARKESMTEDWNWQIFRQRPGQAAASIAQIAQKTPFSLNVRDVSAHNNKIYVNAMVRGNSTEPAVSYLLVVE